MSAVPELKNHDLAEIVVPGVKVEKRPATTPEGKTVKGLYNAWIWLDNPGQYNSYTTEMVKGVILAFRAASNARDVSSVVFTGAGDKAFCTGGNTKEYAEYYAGHPQEYRQYMRLFNDMVSAIRITSYNVCYTKLLRTASSAPLRHYGSGFEFDLGGAVEQIGDEDHAHAGEVLTHETLPDPAEILARRQVGGLVATERGDPADVLGLRNNFV